MLKNIKYFPSNIGISQLVPRLLRVWGALVFVFSVFSPMNLMAQTLPATITVNAASTITSFAPISIFGTNLAYWISATSNNAVSAKVQAAGNYFLRYPGGSSSDDFHWNGTGSFDANHHWVPSGTTWSYGFVGNETYCGTTGSNNAGTHPYSHITDGNAGTTWMSNADTNFSNHQFVYLDLTRANSTVSVSAVSIIWGTPYATSYEVQYWTGPNNPPPYQASSEASWVDFTGGNITGASGGTTVVTFTTAQATRFIRILMTASSAGAGGAYALAEVYALNGAAPVGKTNGPNYQTQPLAVVSSTDPACALNYTASPPGSFDFGSYMTYVNSFTPRAIPLITVNVGTGTPQEAASWVYYANKTAHPGYPNGYGIKYWQVGNEMDGIWETGGPFRADDYAFRFTEYYDAMTAVDSTISLTGPVVGGPNDNSDAYNGLTYIQTFLNTMQTLGKTADIGAVDFHWYPGAVTATVALGTPAQISTFAANLSSWISAAGLGPSVPIFMSEYNINAATPVLMNQLPTGLWLANWLGEFIHYFGNGGHTNLWDTMNGSADLTSTTTGDQGYLDVESNYVNGGVTTANPYQYQPRANYWAMQMMATDWAIAGDSNTHQLVSAASSAATLATYADYRPDGILSLVVVNKDPTNSYNTTLNIGSFAPNATANAWTFDATNYAWETTTIPYHASPDNAPATMTLTGVSSSFPVTFTPYSINVIQFTNSGQPTKTPTFTATPTSSPTLTATKTPTNSPTASPTSTPTQTPPNSPTPTLTLTPTSTPTATFTSTSCMHGLGNTCTFSPTFTVTDTFTLTSTPTPTFTPTATNTPTASFTPTFTFTPTVTFTFTLTFTVTSTPTPSFTPTFTFSSTTTLSPTPTSTPGLIGIFPNPVSGGSPAQVSYQLGQAASQVKLKIFTLAFRKIYEDDSLPTAAGGQLYVLDWNRIGRLANGLYYVVLYLKNGSQEKHQVMKLLIRR